jgi:hypothetical protein
MRNQLDNNQAGDGEETSADELAQAINGGDGEGLAGTADAGGVDDAFVYSESRSGGGRSTLVMFAVLIVGAAGLYVMYRQTGPSSASAAISSANAEAKKTINTFLSGGESGVKLMEKMLRSTEKVVQQFLAYPSMTQIPLSDLRTNPFRAHEKVEKKPAENLSEVAEKKRREEERQAIIKAVQGLQLQSIMYSEARQACMINNSMYREGNVVEGFAIEKITPASVIVKNGQHRFELRMQK